jgi:DNA primase
MIPLETVTQFIQENFPKLSISKNGSHFHARCVLCGDSKKSKNKRRWHMEYNNGQPFYHCFNCERSGSFLELYSELKGISISDAKKELFKFDSQHLVQLLSPRKKEKIVKEIEYENHDYVLEDCIGVDDVPDGVIQAQYQKELFSFIEERKIPLDFKLFVAYKGEYKDRIIIPIYEDGNIVYFQARALQETSYGQKYKNPTLQKGNIILNKENFDRTKYIIVTEGLFDAAQLETQGTSCLGASVNDTFLASLLPLTDIGVIIALDNDKAGIDGIKKILKESKYQHLLKYFMMPDEYKEAKDINKLVTDFDIKNIYQFVVDNSFSNFEIQVKFGIGGK